MTELEYLEKIVYSKNRIESWLKEENEPFHRYDAEFGWLLRNVTQPDGVDNSFSSQHYTNDGHRLIINNKDKKCRINTYGNSMTQCAQVNDAETWQEFLAGHIEEPIRNWGVGGWSVYQAYKRLLKVEKKFPSEYIIFNIFSDDHFRNLDSWSSIRHPFQPINFGPTLPFLKVNLDNNEVKECPNICSNEKKLLNLCNKEWVYVNFLNDFVLKIILSHINSNEKNENFNNKIMRNIQELTKYNNTYNVETQEELIETRDIEASEKHIKAAITASIYIIKKLEDYVAENNKKILYVLSFAGGGVASKILSNYRFDQEFIDFLNNNHINYIDLMNAHEKDYKNHNLKIEDYVNKYWIGHYKPMGNYFTAWAIKNKLVEMLDPKPLAYTRK